MKSTFVKILSFALAMIMGIMCFAVCSFAEEEKTEFLVLGDSIAAGTTLINADVQSYGALVAKTNGYNYKNYAVPGHTTEAFYNRMNEEEVTNAIKDADIIVVSIGGNNFLMNGLVDMVKDGLINNDYSKMDEIMADFNISFDKCIKYIKGLNAGARLFVQTLYNPMPGKIGEIYAEGQKRLNNAYKEYLVTNPDAYTLVDITPLFENHQDYIAYDYIHPNKTGHSVIAKEYLRVLKEMELGTETEPFSPEFKDIFSKEFFKNYFSNLIFTIKNTFNLMFSAK